MTINKQALVVIFPAKNKVSPQSKQQEKYSISTRNRTPVHKICYLTLIIKKATNGQAGGSCQNTQQVIAEGRHTNDTKNIELVPRNHLCTGKSKIVTKNYLWLTPSKQLNNMAITCALQTLGVQHG